MGKSRPLIKRWYTLIAAVMILAASSGTLYAYYDNSVWEASKEVVAFPFQVLGAILEQAVQVTKEIVVFPFKVAS